MAASTRLPGFLEMTKAAETLYASPETYETIWYPQGWRSSESDFDGGAEYGDLDVPPFATTADLEEALNAVRDAPIVARGAPLQDALTTATPSPANPIFSADDAAFASIYYPFVLRVDELIDTPIDTYYMWYSSDHDTGGPGGIGLATAPSREGPWTDVGEVFTDTVTGNQTETPSVLWMPESAEFFMYYQQNGLGLNQSTALAKSPDGVTWTRFGKVLDLPGFVSSPYYEFPGQGHTGYFKPIRLGRLIVGFHTLGGGGYSHLGLSYSLDGEVFHIDPRPLYGDYYLSADIDDRFTLLDPVRARGQWWGIGMHIVDSVASVAAAPMGDNFRGYLAPPVDLVTVGAGEGTTIRSHTLLVDEGRLFVYYSTDTDLVGVVEVT